MSDQSGTSSTTGEWETEQKMEKLREEVMRMKIEMDKKDEEIAKKNIEISEKNVEIEKKDGELKRLREKEHAKDKENGKRRSNIVKVRSQDAITVNLNMDSVNFLGMSITGPCSARGDNGIFVASIMEGGAVAQDGRIEVGDMILQVNDISFEYFTSDQAVDVLRNAVARKEPIKLTVAKCFDSAPESCFTIPRNSQEVPVRL